MAASTLDEAIKRKRVEDALLSIDDLGLGDFPADQTDSDAAATAQSEEETNRQLALAATASKSSTPDIPAHVEDHYGDWKKWSSLTPAEAGAVAQQQSESPAVPSPLPAPRPTEPLEPEYAGVGPTPSPAAAPIESEYVGIAPDQPTLFGGQYSKDAFQPQEKRYPTIAEDQGAELPADALPQVERATMVKLPPKDQAAPDVLPQVERALPAHEAAPDTLPQVERALPAGQKLPGTRTELAPPGQMDLRTDTDVPTAAAVSAQPAAPTGAVQPKVGIDPNDANTWLSPDGTQGAPARITPGGISTLEAGKGDRVDPTKLYSYLQSRFADSGLVGYVPPDGARWGIKTGSAAEWAAFGLAVAKQESDFNPRSYNASDPGGSAGIFQFGQGQTRFTGGSNQFNPQASADAFVKAVQHYVGSNGSVSNLGATFGSIRRPNEAGQYIPFAQSVAAQTPMETEAPAAKKNAWESWETLSPADQATAQAQGQQAQQAKQVADAAQLNDGLSQSGNLIAYYKTLSAKAPEGVNPAVVQTFKDNLQKTITEEMRKRFPDMSPDVAWKKAQEDSSLWDIGAEFLHQGTASFAQLAPVFAQRSADKEQLNAFFDNVLPGGSDADKQALLAQIYALPKEQQGPFIASKIGLPQAGQRGSDAMAVLTAIDHLSDPDFQKKEAARLAEARAFAEKSSSEDPRLKGSAGGAVAGAGAAAEQILAYYGIPIIGAAQAAEETRRQMSKEHPDWDEARLDQESAFSSLAKVYGNTIAATVMGSGAGLLLKSLTTPWKRAAGQVLAGTLTNMGISGGTTIATNIAEGKPAMLGVGESVLTGGVQGALFGGLHGAHELMTPVPITKAPLGEEPVTPPPEMGPKGGEIHGAELPPPGEEVRPPVEEKEQPPVVQQPPVEQQPDAEEQLNKQNQALLDRYKVQGELEKQVEQAPPIEEKPVSADITEDDRARELRGTPGEAGQPERPGEAGPVGGQDVAPLRGPSPRGGEDVSQQLGRVSRPLEVALSPMERAALQPLVDDLARYPQGTKSAKTAYQKLFETIHQRFAPLFNAGGIKRVDNPSDFDGIAAARLNHLGNIEVAFGHGKFESAVRDVMDRGNDPAGYIHGVLQEELIHNAEQLARRDQWKREKAATGENFVDYKFRKDQELIDNWLGARDQVRKKGNHALAEEMTKGLHDSIGLYQRLDPAAAEAYFQDIYQKAKAGHFNSQNRLSNAVSEVVRQMLQLKHGDMPEHSFKQAMGAVIQWFQRAIAGLKSLYLKLGSGQPLAKTELAKLIRATERKLDTLERRAGKAAEPTGPATVGEWFGPEAPGSPKRRFSLGEMINRARLAHSLGFKSGESALLDYKETEPLSIALRREPSLRQAYGQRARLADLERAFNSIPKADRARVTQEWADYIKAEQTKKPLPAVGVDTLRLLQARKDTAQGIGGLLKQLNVHVKDSQGRVRPVKLIGDTYYPWRISNDMRDIFNNRDGGRAAEFNRIVQSEIAAGNIKTRQEFIDKFTHAINGEPHNNDHMSNVERARELRLPYSFYDFSPEAFLHYAGKATDRLAQIGAYGQKLSDKGKDLFDHTIEAVNGSGNLSYEAKQAIINRVASERRAAFERGGQGPLDRIGETGRRAATAAFLSNWQTSFANFVSGASQNMVFGGPGSFLKTAAQFPFKWRQGFKDAREMNVLKTNFKDILNDYDLTTNPSWLQKLTQAGLKYGGQDLTESINRVFGLQQAKNILHDFARDYGVKNNPITRARNQFILRRFGGRPDAAQAQARLQSLATERGIGPLSDEFMRQYVNDVHGTYSQAQAPAHLFDTPTGKLLFQFQKWGFNTSRMANREYIAPMIRAFQSGSLADKGYHVLRNVAYLAAGAGAGTTLQMALNKLYHRDPKDPSLAEIGKAVSEHDYGTASARFIKRAWGALILSGFSGLFGNYADVFNNLTGNDPSGRLKDPMHPPAWGIIEPLISFAKGWAGEGTAVPSEKQIHDFLTAIASPMRVGYNATMGLASYAPGLHFSPAEHYAAQQERSFTRSRIAMFEEQDPAMQQKAGQQGTRQVAIQMAGRRPFDPYRDRILNGLSSGHEIEVNSAIREWLDKVPDQQKGAELKRIKDTINANSPLKVGGSTKPENVMEFLQWAKTNLPEPEARRIYALASTYAQTAMETGLEDRSKPTRALAQLDYDKAQTPAAPSPEVQANAKARAAAQGRQVMTNLAEAVKRQRAVEHLRSGGR